MVSTTPLAHPINLWVMVWDLWDRPSINTYGTALVDYGLSALCSVGIPIVLCLYS